MIYLILLLVKHWYIDFVMQTTAMAVSKKSYGSWLGIWHSLQHGIGTAVITFLFGGLTPALWFGLIDALLHYHIDWCKMNYGCQNLSDPKFWSHLGLDQLAHQLCYILYTVFLAAIWL